MPDGLVCRANKERVWEGLRRCNNYIKEKLQNECYNNNEKRKNVGAGEPQKIVVGK